jgi:hypothetical protein
MSAPKGKRKTKKLKRVARVKKSIPDFDDVQIAILDSCALVSVGYDLLLASSDGKNRQDGCAFVVITHGVELLKISSDQLGEAASYLRRYCSQCGVEQEGAP